MFLIGTILKISQIKDTVLDKQSKIESIEKEQVDLEAQISVISDALYPARESACVTPIPQSIMIFRSFKQSKFDVGKNDFPGARNAGPPLVPSSVKTLFLLLVIHYKSMENFGRPKI